MRKRLAIFFLSMTLATAHLAWGAEAVCGAAEAPTQVEVAKEELTLADVLGGGLCARLRDAAGRVGLGAAPRAGTSRVIDGGLVRQWLAEFAGGNADGELAAGIRVPGRIVVERVGAAKSCQEIGRFLSSVTAAHAEVQAIRPGQGDLHCAAARRVPEDAQLLLAKTAWNAALQRWEYVLRCARPGECLPFLVWRRGEKPAGRPSDLEHTGLRLPPSNAAQLVRAGQMATLIWDQAGIRVVVPVTCLDAGGLGQTVRAQFKNTGGILRAEVVAAGELRASL